MLRTPVPIRTVALSLLLLATVPGWLSAYANHARDSKSRLNADGLITEIEIEGIERTRPQTVHRIARVEPPVAVSELDLEGIQRRLQRSGLFQDDITVAVRPRAAAPDSSAASEFVLSIKLQERWTLLPLPFGAVTSSGWTAGFALYEANLFGTGTMLLTAASISHSGRQVFLSLGGHGLRRGRTALSISGAAGTDERETALAGEDPYERYRRQHLQAQLGLRYELREGLEAGTTAALQIAEVDEGRSAAIRPPSSAAAYRQGFRLSWDPREYHEYFLRGPAARISYHRGFALEGIDNYDVVATDLQYNRPLLADGRLGFRVRGEIGSTPRVFLQSLGGVGFRTLPGNQARADRYAAAAATYEHRIAKLSWASITLLGFGEAGVYQPQDALERFHGPGAGFRVYLSRVAVPALGLDLAYNWKVDEWFVSLALGLMP